VTETIIRTSRPSRLREFLYPASMLDSLARHRDLIAQFTSREVLERHKGAYLGVAWNILNPLITLTIYTFVFGYVLKSRWQQAESTHDLSGTTVAFVLPFFVGHALFHFFSECINRAPTVVASRPNFVRKVVFPVEILPVVSVLSGAVYPLVCIPCLLIAQLVIIGHIPATALLLPIVVLPLALICFGLSWFLASVGVFLRDSRHVIVVLTQLLMFLTPVFYPIELIPESWRGLYRLNPLAIVIENARAVALWGTQPNWLELGILIILSAACAQLGFAYFMKTKRGLSDVV